MMYEKFEADQVFLGMQFEVIGSADKDGRK
jgi:hypothetical protein